MLTLIMIDNVHNQRQFLFGPAESSGVSHIQPCSGAGADPLWELHQTCEAGSEEMNGNEQCSKPVS